MKTYLTDTLYSNHVWAEQRGTDMLNYGCLAMPIHTAVEWWACSWKGTAQLFDNEFLFIRNLCGEKVFSGELVDRIGALQKLIQAQREIDGPYFDLVVIAAPQSIRRTWIAKVRNQKVVSLDLRHAHCTTPSKHWIDMARSRVTHHEVLADEGQGSERLMFPHEEQEMRTRLGYLARQEANAFAQGWLPDPDVDMEIALLSNSTFKIVDFTQIHGKS